MASVLLTSIALWGGIGTAAVPGVSLNFTWDYFPTFVKISALDTPDNITVAARNFRMVLVAMHTSYGTPTEKDALETVAQLKAVNSSVPVLYYLNTEKMLNSTATVKDIIKAYPEALLRGDDGSIIHPDKFPGDYTLDYRHSGVADYYLSECLNATSVADGCLLDSASNFNEPDEMINEGGRLTLAEQNAYVDAKRSALQRLQQAVAPGKGMFVHCGHCFPPAKTCAGVNAQGSQVFHPTMEWVNNLQTLAREGKALKIYSKSRGKKSCNYEKSRGRLFAAFLVGAGPNMFWNCGPNCDNNYVYPEYTKPLGAPLSDAKEEKGVLIRKFAHGVVAKFKPGKNATEYGEGCVKWGDGKTTGHCP